MASYSSYFFGIGLFWFGALFSTEDARASSPIQVDLCHPTYHDGVLYTEEGGIIQNNDLRVQARHIEYIRKLEEGKLTHRVEAEGDLMVQYKGRIYVGQRLKYDFSTRSGLIDHGKTCASFWYIGGDQIQINPDGSYTVINAFITTCENSDSSWDLHAHTVDVLPDDLVAAKKVRFRLFKIPTFWLPSFKVNLRQFKAPIFTYFLNWDKGQGPRASFRYQLYSWRDFAIYGRAEYRLSTGFGGAIETEYLPQERNLQFVTRSYLATDRLENAPDRMRRYRLQGALHATSDNERTTTSLTWDKYSDVRMPGDFPSEDFEVNTADRTLFYLRHNQDTFIASLKVRPRVNRFESIQQDLPTLFATLYPHALGKSGIIHTNFTKLSYVNFVYSDQLTASLPGFRSARLEFRESLYRPLHFGPCILTPQLGATGIFYSNSPTHRAQMLALLTYGGSLIARGIRHWTHYAHILEPHCTYIGLSHPTSTPSEHYLFTIQDGYQQLNQLQIGIRNLLFSKKQLTGTPTWSANLYTNAFFFDSRLTPPFQKIYLLCHWSLPSCILTLQNVWNIAHQLLDRSIFRCRWTWSEHAAFAIEGRYRSQYDWRKADPDNFILDATRDESELLLSPLSDQRIALLTDLFFRPSPFWECHIQSHHGFDRLTETPYNELKADLFTWISSILKVRLSYTHTTKDDRFGVGISLEK